MGQIVSRNTRGKLETNMDPGSAGGGPGGIDLGSLWRLMTQGQTGYSNPYRRPSQQATLSSEDPYESHAKALAMRRMVAETNALSRPVPSKKITIGMSEAFSTPDEMAMTGAQRQMFLPANAENQATAGAGYREMLEAQQEVQQEEEDRQKRQSAIDRSMS